MKKIKYFPVAGMVFSCFFSLYCQSYSWQKTHAKVLPGGNLEWNPEPFVYAPGSSVRYIDYESGDDNNSGTDPSSPWKHHPWDPAATGKAYACTGIHTYVFKRGVIYRGILQVKESGAPNDPIKLTSDPAWGSGEAMFFGSRRITGGWTKADSSSAPKIPNPGKVWYIDLPSTMPATKMVAEIRNDSIIRIPLARSPNWKISDSLDPMHEWWRWTGTVNGGTAAGYRIDTVHLVQPDPDYWTNGYVWSEYNGVMGTLWGEKIISYDPATHSIKTGMNFGGAGARYYIENLPQLLDTTSEYFFDKNGPFPGRLYIRLSGDRDPNTTIIEVAEKSTLISLWSKNNIEISGLSFAFTTYDQYHWTTVDASLIAPVISVNENCYQVKISHCKFNYVNAGIALRNAPDPAYACHDICICDNEMNHIDDQAITCGSQSHDYLVNISILRNKITDNGGRQLCRWYSSVPAISGKLISGEVAGNVIDFSYGSGIYMFWGKDDGDTTRTVPFIRGMVHHNRVDRTMLAVNDYGGIESWQGGPAYYFNNYSSRARGLTYSGPEALYNPWAFPFYFDGAFKTYCFNNIAIGPGNNLTDKTKRYRAAYQQVLGFHNMFVNNTAHNFVYGFTVQGHSGSTPGYNCYLGNLLDDISYCYFNNGDLPVNLIPYEAYGYNIFSKKAQMMGSFSSTGSYTLFSEFKNALASKNALLSQTGYESETSVLTNGPGNNFMPLPGSEALDHGVKFFVPFSLYAVAGEWHFYRCLSYTTIPGSNFYFTKEYGPRADYLNQPKNHLNAVNVNHTSYVPGILEDWTHGALRFDGATTYCYLADAEVKKKMATNLDMDKESFIIETYLRTAKGHTRGTLVAKYTAAGNGYAMDIDEGGHVRVRIRRNGNDVYTRSSVALINDSAWHHVLAEVVRKKWTVNLYVDGKASNGTETGEMPEVYETLSNTGDFLVGKSPEGNFYKGDLDFLRISKGSLADALTTIEELYAWQSDGPFLKDFAGNSPQGRRDAGALEAGKTSCSLSADSSKITFDYYKGTKTTHISPEDEFTFHVNAPWITPSENNGTISLYATSNMTSQPRTGILYLYGCYDTLMIPLYQPINPYLIRKLPATQLQVAIYPNPAREELTIECNDEERKQISITNIYGQEVMNSVLTTGVTLNIRHLPPGMYVINIMDDKKVGYIEKIIKE